MKNTLAPVPDTHTKCWCGTCEHFYLVERAQYYAGGHPCPRCEEIENKYPDLYHWIIDVASRAASKC